MVSIPMLFEVFAATSICQTFAGKSWLFKLLVALHREWLTISCLGLGSVLVPGLRSGLGLVYY